MEKFKDYINEDVKGIANRFKKLVKHYKEGYIAEAVIGLNGDHLKVDYKLINRAIVRIENFEDSFIDRLHFNSANLKKINLDKLSDKEFIEWLSQFVDSYYFILIKEITSYLKPTEILANDISNTLLPGRLRELSKEFNIFVASIRSILNRLVPGVDSYLRGNDVSRLLKKDYSTSKDVGLMIEPTLLESGIVESLDCNL